MSFIQLPTYRKKKKKKNSIQFNFHLFQCGFVGKCRYLLLQPHLFLHAVPHPLQSQGYRFVFVYLLFPILQLEFGYLLMFSIWSDMDQVISFLVEPERHYIAYNLFCSIVTVAHYVFTCSSIHFFHHKFTKESEDKPRFFYLFSNIALNLDKFCPGS